MSTELWQCVGRQEDGCWLGLLVQSIQRISLYGFRHKNNTLNTVMLVLKMIIKPAYFVFITEGM
ncbi:hypothetical protein BDV40DRAFT_281153 [Aspergillus tamarii]|uniref:Uncharacterized protein n=1 Tax=Aspergillus tamarii TaxID=41984 RepID=A0A5N6UDY3_ASPTM|nr:hypothetical protein BDV40DRAFT_281153 [Aspergillus tamarii]